MTIVSCSGPGDVAMEQALRASFGAEPREVFDLPLASFRQASMPLELHSLSMPSATRR